MPPHPYSREKPQINADQLIVQLLDQLTADPARPPWAQVLVTLLEAFGLSAGAIFLRNRTGDHLKLQAALGLSPDANALDDQPIRARKTGVAGRSAYRKAALLVPRLNEHSPERSCIPSDLRATLAIPFISAGEVWGVWQGFATTPRAFRAPYRHTFEEIIAHLSGTVRLLVLYTILERGKHQWEAAFDAVDDLLSIHSLDYRIVRANKALARRLGVEPKDLIGRPCYEVFHRTSAPPPDCPLREVTTDNNTIRRDVHHYTLPGEFEIKVKPIEGEPDLVVHILHDVTAHRRQTRILEALNQFSLATLSAAGREEAIFEALGRTCQQIGVHALVALCDEKNPDTLTVRYLSLPAPVLQTLRKQIGEPLTFTLQPPEQYRNLRSVIYEHQTLFLKQFTELVPPTDPLMNKFARFVRDHTSTRHAVVAPLRATDRTLGLIILLENEIQEDDRAVVQAFADQLAAALENIHLIERETKQREHLARLVQATQQIAATLEPQLVLQEILTQAQEILHADRVAIYILDRERDRLHCEVQLGLPEEYVQAINTHYRKVPGSKVLDTPQFVVVEDIQTNAQMPPRIRELARDAGIHSLGVLPLIHQGESIGAMALYRDTVHPFTQEELQLGTALAQQAASAIVNSQLYAAERRRAVQLDLIQSVGQRLISALDLEELLPQIVYEIQTTFSYDHVSLFLIDEKNQLANLAAVSGLLEDEMPPDYHQPLDQGLVGRAARTGQIVCVGDVHSDPDFVTAFPSARELIHSELCVPIRWEEKTLGVLSVKSHIPDAFDHSDEDLLATIAHQIAVALHNAILFNQVEQARAFVEAILDTAGALIVVFDAEGRILRINSTCERVLGYRAEDVIGQPLTAIIQSDSAGQLLDTLNQLVAGTGPQEFETTITTRFGDKRVILWSNRILESQEGDRPWIVSAGLDITTLRQTQEELRKRNLQLRQTQAKLVRAERMAAIGQISIAVRHEINNPLTAVMGLTELLLIDDLELPEHVRRDLETIYENANRIKRVLERLERVQDRVTHYAGGVQMIDLWAEDEGEE